MSELYLFYLLDLLSAKPVLLSLQLMSTNLGAYITGWACNDSNFKASIWDCIRVLGYSYSEHRHTHTQVSGIRKVKPVWILLMQETVSGSDISRAICKSAPQTDNHTSTSPLSFLQSGCPSCHPANSMKALKAIYRMYVQKHTHTHTPV